METSSILLSLPKTERDSLMEKYPVVRLKPGERLHKSGEPVTRVWLVLKGALQGVEIHDPRASMVMCRAMRGSTFGACCAVDRQTYPCEALAEAPTEVLPLPLDEFQQLISRYPKFGFALAGEMSKRLNACMQDRLDLQGSVDDRLRAAVASLIPEHGRHLPVPRRELARLARTSVEAAIRTVQMWREKGWVEARWKFIYIKRLTPFRRRRNKTS